MLLAITRLHVAAVLLFVTASVPASAQGTGPRLIVLGGVGTHLNAGVSGDTESIAAGLSLGRFDLLIGGERIHIPTERSQFGATRGGTSRFVTGEIRVSPVTFGRTAPYLLAGFGRGTSRPTVNEIFPNPVTNDAWLLFAGAGARVALTNRLGAFADVRAGIQGELDSAFLLVPLRVGLAWRF
ncbi:MAG: hypothetical protein AB7H93_18955 [Vicinamibacterales bacterium]